MNMTFCFISNWYLLHIYLKKKYIYINPGRINNKTTKKKLLDLLIKMNKKKEEKEDHLVDQKFDFFFHLFIISLI